MQTNSTSRIARLAMGLSAVAMIAACGESPTAPVAAPTTFVTISVSCDVSVSHDGSQYRVNYCTNAVGGGLIANALVLPGSFNTDRQGALKAFGTCMNRRTAIEQQSCYPMLEKI